ncbi:hypothetical protein M3Y99_01736700 [Aphelenchoides fujianensis]|nr:hypothetical protein M3Y99_01736700 [Aphelenchoides fujianensis]
MAESNRQLAGRKRKKAGEEKPPIVQLSSAQLCGCLKCWKTAVIRSPNRRSARLAAKKPKRAGGGAALDHELQPMKNSFVYEGQTLDEVVACSADGRHMFVFTNQMDLLVVDLLLCTQKLMKPQRVWDRRMFVWAFVALSNTAILLAGCEANDRDGHDELHLLRFGVDSEQYERTLLDNCLPDDSRIWAITEISGQDVDLKRLVVGHFDPIVFCRLDVDEARMVVDDTIDVPEVPGPPAGRELEGPFFFAQLSKDGRKLYTLDALRPDTSYAYSFEEKKWAEEKLQGMSSDRRINVLDFNQKAGRPLH